MEDHTYVPQIMFSVFNEDNEDSILLYTCPICSTIANPDWDKQEHKRIYPTECSLCGRKFLWTKDLMKKQTLEPLIPEKCHYLATGYFTKFKEGKIV